MTDVPRKYADYSTAVHQLDQQEMLGRGKDHIIRTLTGNSVLGALRSRFAEDAAALHEMSEERFEREVLPGLSSREWIEELIERLMDREQLSLLFPPGLKAVDAEYFNALEVFSNAKLSVLLSRVDRSKLDLQQGADARINVTSFTTYLYFVRSGEARIKLFEAEPGVSCRATEMTVSDGQLLKICGGRNSMKFLEARSDPLVLGINFFDGSSRQIYRIDSDTGALHSRSTSDMYAQRAFMYSSLLRLLDREDAVGALGGLLEHHDEELRWHAMREMLALDADQATPHLCRLAEHDRSARVRAIASGTLRKLGLAQAE